MEVSCFRMKINSNKRIELFFRVEKEDDWLVASCDNPVLATQAKNLEELIEMVKDLLLCHFDEDDPLRHAQVRLHFATDPILTMA